MSYFQRQVSNEDLIEWLPPAVRYVGIDSIQLDQKQGTLSSQFIVGDQNVQPHGILHGGVSVLIAETLASIGANLCLVQGFAAVGQTIQASHIRPAAKGEVVKVLSSPVHVGKSSQVWSTDFYDGKSRLVCRVSLTLAVIRISDGK